MATRDMLARVVRLAGTLDTPCLLYDQTDLLGRFARIGVLCASLNATIGCSWKAMPTYDVGALVARRTGFVDISNESELMCVMRECAVNGLLEPTVSVTGPQASMLLNDDAFSRLRESGKARLHGERLLPRAFYNADNYGQLNSVAAISDLPFTLGIRLRLNIAGLDEAHQSRFGFNEQEVKELISCGIASKIQCLHVHGREPHSHGRIGEIAERVMQVAEMFEDRIKYVNLGGGLDLSDVDTVKELMLEVRNRIPMPIHIIFEPGEGWFAKRGFALGKLLGARHEEGRTLYLTDISALCHLRWSKPNLLYLPAVTPAFTNILLTGPTCFENDIIGAFCGTGRWGGAVGVDKVILSDVSSYSARFNCAFNGVDKASTHVII